MSQKPPAPNPTNAELEILRVLWRRGPSTVRYVHQALDREPPVGYTTVLKLLQIMIEKGLVTRDEASRSHVYQAAVSEDVTKRRLVSDLLDRAFEGSALGLVMQALAARPASREDLQRIKQILDQGNTGGRS
ncbi:MAG TPA: BlaI/MecI/CopY family transcriptional regulator [Gemmatimonadales bacterium]